MEYINTPENIFHEIYNNNDTVEFVVYYNGIPLRHEATIKEFIKDNNIIFKTNLMQVMAIKEVRKVMIVYSKYDDICFEADYYSLDVKNKNCIVLTNFTIKSIEHVKRLNLRVVPDKSFTLTIIDPLVKIYHANAIDISDEAIAFTFPNELPSRINEDTLFHVKMGFNIDDDKHLLEISIKSKLLRLEREYNQDKFVAKFENISNENRKMIDEYLNKRQLHIIKDFKAILKDSY